MADLSLFLKSEVSVKLKSSTISVAQVKAQRGIFHKLSISSLHCHTEFIMPALIKSKSFEFRNANANPI